MQNRFSPLRYPGGKGKLTEYIRLIFETNGLNGGHYVEPYAGGAAVALSLLFLENASHIHINDLNRSIYAFWYCVLNETEEFCRKISKTRVSATQWRNQKAIQENRDSEDLLDVGYSTFFLNRTNRSGIIGNGGMIGGVEQTGRWLIDARFNKKELIERIQKVASFSSRISLYNLDACVLLKKISSKLPEKTLLYLDPPYYVQGKRLYQHHYDHDDHVTVANVVRTLSHRWVVSYDDVEPIHKMYKGCRKRVYGIGYSARNAYEGSEVVFFSQQLVVPKVDNPLKITRVA